MLQIKTDLYRYVHYTSNVAVCNYQELIGCDVSFMVVLISERHGGLFYDNLINNKSDDLRYSFGESAVFTQRLENNRKRKTAGQFLHDCREREAVENG